MGCTIMPPGTNCLPKQMHLGCAEIANHIVAGAVNSPGSLGLSCSASMASRGFVVTQLDMHM